MRTKNGEKMKYDDYVLNKIKSSQNEVASMYLCYRV